MRADSEEKTAAQTNKSEGRVEKRSDGMGGVAVGGGVNRVGHRQEEIMAVIGKKRRINVGNFFLSFSPILFFLFFPPVQLPGVSFLQPLVL